MLKLLLGLLVLIVSASSQEVRLPKALMPESYTILLKTYLDDADGARKFSFDGQSTVNIKCITPTNQIVMHARDLDFQDSAIQVRQLFGGQAITVLGVTRDTTRETLTITLPAALAPNDRISVSINYIGYHRDQNTGFFKIAYQTDNQPRVMVAAHMQANFAHRVFPCFDEPNFKALFSLTIQHRQGRRAWSNTPSTGERDIGNGWKETSFVTSPLTSTYTVGMVVADFQCVTKATNKNVQVSVCARPDAVRNGLVQFAVNEAVNHLQFYENYFEVSLPQTKFDLIAFPGYQWYAVENWGLPLFNEFALFYDQSSSRADNQVKVSNIVAHEVSHQWDGSFVSFDWWNDFWVKEGAANWLEYLATDASLPGSNDVQIVFPNHYAVGSVRDALPNVVPLNNPSITLASMGNYFTLFNFAKATALIRMLNGALGDNTFRKGFGNFYRTRAYTAVTASDLWLALTDQARIDQTLPIPLTVKDIMSTYTEQPGVPVLITSRQADGTLALSQERFLVNPGTDPLQGIVAPYNFKWWLPISWASSSNGKIKMQPGVQWMGPSTAPTLNVGQSPNWYLVNINAFGYYRVQYDYDNWNLIATQLRVDRNQIPTLSRTQLMMDSFTLLRAERINALPLIWLTSTMKTEQDYTVWAIADQGIGFMMDTFEKRPIMINFKLFISCQLSDQMSRINMESTESQNPAQTQMKRPIIVARSCALGMPLCVGPATKMWAKWRSAPDTNPIPDDIRGPVYCAAVQAGTADDWNFVFSKMQQPGYPDSDASKLRQALSCTSNVDLLNKLLNALKPNDIIKPPASIEIVGYLLENPLSRQVAWDWLKNNKQWIQLQQIPSPVPFATMIQNKLAPKLTTDAELADLKTMESAISTTADAKPLFDGAVERVASNIRWRNANEDTITYSIMDMMNTYKCGSGSLDVAKPAIILSLLFATIFSRLLY